jgi:hypothetical protein
MFGVDRQDVQKYLKNREQILSAQNNNSCRKIKFGDATTKGKFNEIESKVYDEILDKRSNNICVTVSSIQNKMLELVKSSKPSTTTSLASGSSSTTSSLASGSSSTTSSLASGSSSTTSSLASGSSSTTSSLASGSSSTTSSLASGSSSITTGKLATTSGGSFSVITEQDITDFKATHGWVTRFMRRWSLVTRRISGSGRSFKSDTPNTIQEYLVKVRGLSRNLALCEIINFDESSYYMDSVGNMTVATKGARKTYCQTTGKEKTRISVLMCSTASGHKFKPLCVVPRKKKLKL